MKIRGITLKKNSVFITHEYNDALITVPIVPIYRQILPLPEYLYEEYTGFLDLCREFSNKVKGG